MIKKIKDILSNREENFLMPFFWQHGDHTDKLPDQIERIYNSGCRAICIESRPHPEFVKDGWWRDMDIILKEAKKREMKIWVLDDKRFPTGYAAGLIEKKYPHLRQWEIIEQHVDLVGPKKYCSVITPDENEENIIIGAYAYKRYIDEDEKCGFQAIDLKDNIKNGFLYWDVPEGVWRIFFYCKTRSGANRYYIDMLNSESVHALIEAVYEPHYEHYKEYFGNTIQGFFSDEPCFGNGFRYGEFDLRPGKKNLPMPWSEDVLQMMRSSLGYDPVPHLNLLWYEDDCDGREQCELRYAYMDAITELYSKCFNKQLADWCTAHGVLYIGHIIEEICLSSGAGHFFRAMKHQDMSGIDIVLNQILPGMSDFYHSAADSCAPWGSKFYNYVLAKLGASLAHIEPKMNGRAMCEVFGAYGWAEDTRVMKFLMDFLFVRGINHFVPHAFNSFFPDPEFPPHFGAEGKDPSFDGFGALMRYSNKISHLLYGTTHIAKIALLYDEDLHWSATHGKAMHMHTVAKELYDAHFDYDIIPVDYFDKEKVKDGKLCLGEEKFECLIIPHVDMISKKVENAIQSLAEEGLKIYFIDGMPKNANLSVKTVELKDLTKEMRSLGLEDVLVEPGYEKLRIYHCKKDSSDVFMFANEDVKPITTTVTLPLDGKAVRLDVANGLFHRENCSNGKLSISLEPAQSEIIVFCDCEIFEEKLTEENAVTIPVSYELELANYTDMTDFKSLGSFNKYFNVTAPDFMPNFCGKMRYTFTCNAKKAKRVIIDLGDVGQSATLTVNGINCGTRFSLPYLFDVTESIKDGKNKIQATVANTLVYEMRDRLSQNMMIAPSGLLSDIKIKYYK